MESIVRAFKGSLRSFFTPRAMFCLLIPPVAAFFIWAGVVAFFWSSLINVFDVWILSPDFIYKHLNWGADFFFAALPVLKLIWMAAVGFLILGLVFATSILVASGFIIPILLGSIQKKEFPDLEKKGESRYVSSFVFSFLATVEVGFIFILSLPLWLLPGVSVFISAFLTGYLASKIFPYEILSEYATEEELNYLKRANRREHILVGVFGFFTNFFPIAFLVSPLLTALVYIHLCLHELMELRKRGGIPSGGLAQPM